ncbi:MAG: hypothetical protein GY694_22180, partial [Gammaproteobacteria bacterium]|nr:hypothetical protein [Gammaproteobacteria bacterium]
MNTEQIIDNFIAGDYPQIHCDKCENTFLTNVYGFDETHVLLEKRSLGLEYYCGAIHEKGLKKVPDIRRIGVLDEEDNVVENPDREEIYSGRETEFRFIYVMEKLRHLKDEDAEYFNRCVKDMEWQEAEDRDKIIAGVSRRYNATLAQDIAYLYEFYVQHQSFMAWDLHGDNLMERIETGEIVILDPYTRKV